MSEILTQGRTPRFRGVSIMGKMPMPLYGATTQPARVRPERLDLPLPPANMAPPEPRRRAERAEAARP